MMHNIFENKENQENKSEIVIRPAVESMIADAEEVAEGRGEYVSLDDLFKED